jgi:hypothetical protein
MRDGGEVRGVRELRRLSRQIKVMMHSQILVTPAEAEVHGFHNHLKKRNSGFRRNYGKESFRTFSKSSIDV